ncbi:MAG: lipoyl(octanoyl) transferase LipB [Ferruginibacter sp.]
MDKQEVIYKDLGLIEYKEAWDYQETLLQENVEAKSTIRNQQLAMDHGPSTMDQDPSTVNHLLFCEHPFVYTLGKSGSMDNVLLNEKQLEEQHIQFYKINRGGDVTFHGPEQIVGYPILDLEKFYTDIGRYLRELEQVIIDSLAMYNIKGERSNGETGVWIQPGIPGKERKICAMGVRCSRWITMHGFALNVNTDLSYFNNIIPCGIQNKQVTSVEKELGYKVDMNEMKERLKLNFEQVFKCVLVN